MVIQVLKKKQVLTMKGKYIFAKERSGDQHLYQVIKHGIINGEQSLVWLCVLMWYAILNTSITMNYPYQKCLI
jgi:hypothetical protein